MSIVMGRQYLGIHKNMKIGRTKLIDRNKQYSLTPLRLRTQIELAIIREVLSVYCKYQEYKRRVSTTIRHQA
jgi:hypothetical protein